MKFSLEPSLQIYQRLTLLAAVLMLLPLPIMQFVGEEGLMAIKSYEMHVRGDWMHPSILGGIWPHSPFWHWPVILISNLIGWEHVDLAIRFTSVLSTWTAAVIAFFTARWLFTDTRTAWLATMVFLSMGEISFWYGWLGYVDATFGMFIFGSIAFLWRAIADESPGWLLAAAAMLSLAFMTKNITAYAFFGASGLIFVWRHQKWYLLKSPLYTLITLAAFSVPWLWQSFVVPAGQSTATTTINDALRNFIGYGFVQYLKHWLTFPLLFVARALPVTLLLAWFWIRRKQPYHLDQNLTTLLLILTACILPFWVSATATPRYLVPFYGLFALLLTGLLLQLNPQRLRQVVSLVALFILLKIPYSTLALPYIKDWRPERDVKQIAHEVIELTEGAPLYTRNDIASGLAVTAYIDVWRQDRQPVFWYRSDKLRGVYIMTEGEEPEFGELVKSWRLRGDHLYLYWRADTNHEQP